MTELIEPAGRVDAESRNKLESLALQVIKSWPNLECIALCGTLPPGISGSTYTLIAENKPDHVWLFLDAYQDISCLKTGKVDILKINSEEALILAGMYVDFFFGVTCF
jgi:fructose-1-phosphate kinase PfkB-like protein